MTKLWTKLRSSKGETLVETLVAMMILSLVSAFLFVMINGSYRLNSQAAQQDTQFYTALSNVESKNTATSAEKEITITYNTNVTYTPTVTVYSEAGLVSYDLKEGP